MVRIACLQIWNIIVHYSKFVDIISIEAKVFHYFIQIHRVLQQQTIIGEREAIAIIRSK
jgi:hypothetical protein